MFKFIYSFFLFFLQMSVINTWAGSLIGIKPEDRLFSFLSYCLSKGGNGRISGISYAPNDPKTILFRDGLANKQLNKLRLQGMLDPKYTIARAVSDCYLTWPQSWPEGEKGCRLIPVTITLKGLKKLNTSPNFRKLCSEKGVACPRFGDSSGAGQYPVFEELDSKETAEAFLALSSSVKQEYPPGSAQAGNQVGYSDWNTEYNEFQGTSGLAMRFVDSGYTSSNAGSPNGGCVQNGSFSSSGHGLTFNGQQSGTTGVNANLHLGAQDSGYNAFLRYNQSVMSTWGDNQQLGYQDCMYSSGAQIAAQ